MFILIPKQILIVSLSLLKLSPMRKALKKCVLFIAKFIAPLAYTTGIPEDAAIHIKMLNKMWLKIYKLINVVKFLTF